MRWSWREQLGIIIFVVNCLVKVKLVVENGVVSHCFVRHCFINSAHIDSFVRLAATEEIADCGSESPEERLLVSLTGVDCLLRLVEELGTALVG